MDGFDLLTTRAAPAGDAATLGANGSSSSPFDLAAMDAVLTPASTGAKPKKSPETFLGPNSNLVNLENLVQTNHPRSWITCSSRWTFRKSNRFAFG